MKFEIQNFQIYIQIKQKTQNQMIHIDNPVDEDIGAETDGRFYEDQLVPEIYTYEKSVKKKKKFKVLRTETKKQMRQPQNYFQKMYKETKKKIYVSMFIRKLRQTIPSRQNFTHPLCQNQNDQFYGAMKRFRCNLNIEALFICLVILSVWIASLVTTLRITFEQVRESTRLMNILFVCVGLCEILYNIFVKSRISCLNTKRNLDYANEAVHVYFQSGWMVFDIMISVIFLLNMIIFDEIIGYLELMILFKIKQVNQKMRSLQIIFIQNNFKEQYWELIKVFIFNFLFAHFLAIVLALLGNSDNSWIKVYNFQETWYIVYVWAYYWATNIMLTVGFGDISATSPQEALCLIFIQTLSCIVLAYNINSIGNIIQKITSYEAQKSANLKIFMQMQQEEGVSDDVKVKITDFITQSAELKKKFNVTEEQQFLQKLPKTFYEQFKIQSTYKIFQNLPFFRNLNVKKLQELSIKIEKKLSHPEQVLIQNNTIPKILIFNNGVLSLHMKCSGRSDGRQVQTLQAKKQQYKLVSQYFIANKPINHQIRCKDYSIVYSISKDELIQILSSNPYSYEYYCMSRDRDRFNPNDLEIENCSLCSNKYHKAYHTFFDCPKFHYQPLKQLVIEKELKNKKKSKNIQLRNSQRLSMNPLIIYSELEDMFNAAYFNSKPVKKMINSPRQFISDKNLSITQIKSERQITDNLIGLAEKKANFILSISKHKSSSNTESSGNVQKVCKKIGFQIGEQIKDEFMKTMAISTSKYIEVFSDINCDIAYNFPFYFQKSNPDSLSKNFRTKEAKKTIKM